MRLITSLLVVAATVTFGALAVHSTGRVMNCGGNSAALANARNLAQVAMAGMGEAKDHSFRFAEASEEWHEALRHSARYGKARFLVTKRRISENDADYPQLIAVCDMPYRNVPERRFGENPPTHAAAYSDGSAKLISPEEFAALPKEDFIPVEELFPRAGRGK
jgi:hypothetical protein